MQVDINETIIKLIGHITNHLELMGFMWQVTA
jgi:hypothetical protein